MNDTTYPAGGAPAPPRAEPGAARQRYLQVAHELRAGIAAGTFGEGAQFPTDSVLCERFGVSRFTVREALRRLQSEGLIRRRLGSGGTVGTGGAALRQPLSDVDDLQRYAGGSVFEFDIHGRVTPGETQASAIGLPAGSRWIHLSGSRKLTSDSTPVALSDVFINIDLERHVDALEPGHLSLFEQLGTARGVRITRIDPDIRATAVGGREAKRWVSLAGRPCCGLSGHTVTKMVRSSRSRSRRTPGIASPVRCRSTRSDRDSRDASVTGSTESENHLSTSNRVAE